MIAPARLAAFDTLLAVTARRTDLPSALAGTRAGLADERDRALAGEIATGTLRWQAAFDHVIAQFAGRPASRLDVEVLIILRIGFFQLLHLDRVPASAVVDDAVELTRKSGKSSAAGFVNALLRRVSRERANLPLPAEPASGDRGAAIDYLAITLSHPRWLAERWLDRYGFDACAHWAAFDNQPAPLTIRADPLRGDRDALATELQASGVETDRGRFAPDALVVRSGNPLLTPLAHTGRFTVQDEASQLVGLFVDAAPGERVLDTCASPGGKSTQMAASMRDRGAVIAADVRGRRISLLGRAIAEARSSSIRVVQADARHLPFAAAFDAVLVDAPCSGLGTLRRDPDIRWRREEQELASLADTQLQMLASAAAVVRPGGRLVYSTCSSEPDENEAVVEAFLSRHPGFSAGRCARFDGDPVLAAVLDAQGRLRTLPFRDGLEAFFAAMLVKHKDLR